VRSVNQAMALGRLDRTIPYIKKNSVEVLTQVAKESRTEAEGLEMIRQRLKARYAQFQDQEKIEKAIAEVQRIFRETIFPEMKASWMSYPDNIGHSIWPGCIRCHDGEHVSADGRVISHECDTCHIITAQGPGLEPQEMSAKGLEFHHPGGDIGKELLCGNCHSGTLAQ